MKGMYLAMGLLLKGGILETKSTQHQQKASNFAQRKILMLLPWLKYRIETNFSGWHFNQGTTCLKMKIQKSKLHKEFYLEARVPIWAITHDYCEH